MTPISTSSLPDKFPFPQSHRILQVDQKGNVVPVRLSVGNLYKLKVEKVDYSVPATPSSPAFHSQMSPKNPKSPATPLKRLSGLYEFFDKRFSLGSSSRTSSIASNYGSMSSSPSSVVSEELIPLEEIQEIRLSDYNSKLLTVSTQALKELKPVTGGSKKNFANKYKIMEILFGSQFNLKNYKFLVTGFYDFFKQQQREQTNAVEEWIQQVKSQVKESKSLEYFEKLSLWYKKHFDVIIDKNTGNHRLKIYKQFLHRCHVRVSTFDLRIELDYLERIVREQNPYAFIGDIEKSEFDVMARYFVHSSTSMSKIFESFCPGGENNNVLQILDEATEEQLNNHPVLSVFQSLFMNYFKYMKNYGRDLPKISTDMDGVSMHTKAVIRKFADIFQQQREETDAVRNQLFQENWLCSYYILDYLFSADNSIWCPEGLKLNQDMTRPLAHYWIYSSHNTYLTGDQYSSESSVESYARVLRQGCRCIEIDVWNGPNNKPLVKHGRTLTTSVKLSHVLLTIKAHAFATSPYPIIISIENHCNLRQQKTIAKYFRKIFGKMLVTAPLVDNIVEGQITQLPSPEQLKYKIILKGRKLPFAEEETHSVRTSTEDSLKDEFVDPNFYPGMGYPKAESSSTICSSNTQEANSCDCLISGELWKSNENGKWIACIFVLTNKKLFYVEKRGDNDDIGKGKLPNYMKQRSLFIRQSVSSVDSNPDLHNDQLWFHGKMAGGRQAAVLLLEQHAVNGSFLVRESETTPNGYTLCFYYKNPDQPEKEQGPFVNHCHIHRKTQNNETVYFLKNDPAEHEKFPSIYELIEYYMRNPLITRKCELSSLNLPVPPSRSHESEEWFYKNMNRKGSERILEKLPINGAFLGRYRTEDKGEIVISFRVENVIKHCHIKREGRYLTVANSKFSKLESLVEHYSRNAFYKDIKLDHKVGKELHIQSQQTDCVQRVYACPGYVNSTVKTVKGRVRAIQSFTSDDPDLLSFKKGEIIVNVVKEADGWWSGTKEDAVEEEALIPKQFPESFVEDMEELVCPFGDYVNKGTWKLGTGAKIKLCTDKHAKETNIKFYICFKYKEDGTKKRLGASCSKRKTKEWVDMINHVVANDMDGKIALAKIMAAEKYKIASELSDLFVYCCSMDKKICPDEFEWRKDRVDICLTKSLDEVTGSRLFRSRASFFVWYHQYALTRVYPIGFRLDSSNFSPARFWNFGSQMVALNFQTPDKAMQMNRGKFKQNGCCGYVLKPAFIIPGENGAGEFDPTRLNGDGYCDSTELSIQVISARHLQKQGSSHLTPFVEIEVVGVDADCRIVKTSWQETGLNPYWNQTFHLKLRYPELALIQFSVYDMDTFNDKVLVGECTIPFPCIRSGYRSIQLQNAYGSPLISSLLVHVTISKED